MDSSVAIAIKIFATDCRYCQIEVITITFLDSIQSVSHGRHLFQNNFASSRSMFESGYKEELFKDKATPNGTVLSVSQRQVSGLHAPSFLLLVCLYLLQPHFII